MVKNFRREKDLRLFIKKFLKENLKGLPPESKIDIEVIKIKPAEVILKFPFYSEGNLIRANEVDFLLKDLINLGIKAQVKYIDDVEIFEENQNG
ncbi:MAG: hypothetical protein C0190_01495 [Thermodesulfobacterium geofontis]|uniref:DUF59 domain-containing protein n=1 Tax=Thermodesulfobacterium geofontis TaxID=1295609 RepID=A0A2N7PPX8_9BACT|nr:MAG: hypothetical protein C0190_01495 [Thermodesulfobacterium geofontis]PMP97114.1 MAG: hypothetical protein C0169_03945 [Thermodesulfobacterium geofontis]